MTFEVLWARQLALIFGVTTYAIATVLATYIEAFERERYYLDHRRCAVLLLRNLGADTPDAIAARIAERSKICDFQRRRSGVAPMNAA